MFLKTNKINRLNKYIRNLQLFATDLKVSNYEQTQIQEKIDRRHYRKPYDYKIDDIIYNF